jgi:hypothetical protein
VTTCPRPPAGRTPVGPAAHLLALPQLTTGLPATPQAIDDHLARIEHARRAQLDAIPHDPSSLVTVAHRRTVALILDQVQAARARVRAGTHGLCARCDIPILPTVLESQPWQSSCSGCACSDIH